MADLQESKDILTICEQIADYYRKLMADADYDKNGELYNFKEIIEYKGSLFEIYFVFPDYWKYAENGRGPGGRPPLNVILNWLQHKKLLKSTTSKATNITSMACAILWKIAKHGTEGKHLLQKTIDDTYNTLVDLLVEAIADELEKEIDNDIEL